MDLPTPDYQDARLNMVNGQIRPNKVYDPRIVEAMRTLPRERFLPARLAPLAYVDEDLPLGRGRVLMEPMVIARLIEIARVRPGERALVVASGVGYGAAILSAAGADVTAVEDDETLMDVARELLPGLAPGVALVAGPVTDGAPGPWPLILIEGAIRAIPANLAALVAPGGRLVTVLARRGGAGQGVLAEPNAAGTLRSRPEFDANTPLLPQFEPTPVFTF